MDLNYSGLNSQISGAPSSVLYTPDSKNASTIQNGLEGEVLTAHGVGITPTFEPNTAYVLNGGSAGKVVYQDGISSTAFTNAAAGVLESDGVTPQFTQNPTNKIKRIQDDVDDIELVVTAPLKKVKITTASDGLLEVDSKVSVSQAVASLESLKLSTSDITDHGLTIGNGVDAGTVQLKKDISGDGVININSALNWFYVKNNGTTAIATTNNGNVRIPVHSVTTTPTSIPTFDANSEIGHAEVAGTGKVVMDTSPQLITPDIGDATGTTLDLQVATSSLTQLKVHGGTTDANGISIDNTQVGGPFLLYRDTDGSCVASSSSTNWLKLTTAAGTIDAVVCRDNGMVRIPQHGLTENPASILAFDIAGNNEIEHVVVTGFGKVVMDNSALLVDPNIGDASGSSLNLVSAVSSYSQLAVVGQTAAPNGILIDNEAVGAPFHIYKDSDGSGVVETSSTDWLKLKTIGGEAVVCTNSGNVRIPQHTLTTTPTSIPTFDANSEIGHAGVTGTGSVVLSDGALLTNPDIGDATGDSLTLIHDSNIDMLSLMGETAGNNGLSIHNTVTGPFRIYKDFSGEDIIETQSSALRIQTQAGGVDGLVVRSTGNVRVPVHSVTPAPTSIVAFDAFSEISHAEVTGSGKVVMDTSPTIDGATLTNASISGASLTSPDIGISTGDSLHLTNPTSALTTLHIDSGTTGANGLSITNTVGSSELVQLFRDSDGSGILRTNGDNWLKFDVNGGVKTGFYIRNDGYAHLPNHVVNTTPVSIVAFGASSEINHCELTGTGKVVMDTSPTITTPVISGIGSGVVEVDGSGNLSTGSYISGSTVPNIRELSTGTSVTTTAGCKYAEVWVVGAGGGGGAGGVGGTGGGGASGAIIKYFVTAGTYSYSLGAGGTGGTSGGDGTAGGSTSFNGGAAIAPGGLGGIGNGNGSYGGDGDAGTPTTPSGGLYIKGNPGVGGGGGQGRCGGSAPGLGGGGPATSGAGGNGQSIGAGGGGARNNNDGGAGAGGGIILYEYF